MLIKKYFDNNENKEVSLYNSSNILGSEFDKENNELTVIFNRGAKYIYKNVEGTDYVRFNTAKSQGKALNEHIKPNYEYLRKDDVDVDKYEKKVKEASKKEVEQIEKELSEIMEECIDQYQNNGTIQRGELGYVESLIKTMKDYEQS